nr:pyruvate, phosphate dikinase regulatory protein, chloroplastic [Tanacetum cinerariifolium]
MLLKQSDPMVLEKKVKIKTINYAKLNQLFEDFGKRFVPQQELSDEQAFRLQTSHPNTDQSAYSPIKIEAPRELPKTNTSVNQIEPLFDQLFELNNLRAVLQAKDTTIKKLKEHIKDVNETNTSESVKKDFDEIETINIELEHRVTKLIAKNEHSKQMYKQLYDSIKPSRVHAKEQTESLVNQVNQKKLKGKEIADNAAQVPNATTIALEMYKLDLVTLAHRDKNNREAHIYYLKHTIEQATILREIVEQA